MKTFTSSAVLMDEVFGSENFVASDFVSRKQRAKALQLFPGQSGLHSLVCEEARTTNDQSKYRELFLEQDVGEDRRQSNTTGRTSRWRAQAT